MHIIKSGVLMSGLILSACLYAGPGPGEAAPIPPIDAEAPAVFETATFSLG